MNNKEIYTSKFKFKLALVIFSLMGQIAWVIENMYLNVFIYKMFNASASQISLMVMASAITAAVTTLLIGALSDRLKKRKLFISMGYIFWGVSILSFAFVKLNFISSFVANTVQASSLAVSIVIFLDCLMTFFGSSANDASFNAWLTDCGTSKNRGKIEGINSMMPLVAIIAVFGGFMAFDLDKSESWTYIFLIIGIAVIFIGILGFVLIEDHIEECEQKYTWFESVIYSFRPSVIKKNNLLYIICIAMAIFGTSIQVFMPYLILYYEKSLGMSNYVIVMVPAILIAAVVSVFFGRLYDKKGFKFSVVISLLSLLIGYVILYLSPEFTKVFIGSLFMMIGYLTTNAVLTAMIRDLTPSDKTGMFQGIRIIAMVFIPGIIGPFIGMKVLQNAELVQNSDGTFSFLPNKNIFLAALIVALVFLMVLIFIFKKMSKIHRELKTFTPEEKKLSYDFYPRPQLKRDSFLNLNGEWELNGKKIIVPFPPESKASKYVGRKSSKWEYKKIFTIPKDFIKERVILHFGAVDQIANVFVDGKFVFHHEGGYLPFSVDITDYLNESEKHTLLVYVEDRLLHKYPYGKQTKNPGGMWYTPVSGIWQTVWIESVNSSYIDSLKITPTKNSLELKIKTSTQNFENQKVNFKINIKRENQEDLIFESEEGEFSIPLSEKKGFEHWTVENPKLYNFSITAFFPEEKQEDVVESYFAWRVISIEEKKLCLNGKPIFLHAVLDQGYYPEGIYLPENPYAFEMDILNLKKLGFNTLRKHIKIEPDYFYYLCDKLGIFVMQDMVNNGSYRFFRDTVFPTFISKKGKKSQISFKEPKTETELIFEETALETLNTLHNHPCIIYYTIFNEGWGQRKAEYFYNLLKGIDSSRVYDTCSGWFKGAESDVESEHIYFKTPNLEKEVKASEKPYIVSECGGYTLEFKENTYSVYGRYGYGACTSKEEFTKKFINLYEKMILPSIPHGMCGCVYTQLSDVEDEINGLYTYDRKICKLEENELKSLSEKINSLL